MSVASRTDSAITRKMAELDPLDEGYTVYSALRGLATLHTKPHSCADNQPGLAAYSGEQDELRSCPTMNLIAIAVGVKPWPADE